MTPVLICWTERTLFLILESRIRILGFRPCNFIDDRIVGLPTDAISLVVEGILGKPISEGPGCSYLTVSGALYFHVCDAVRRC